MTTRTIDRKLDVLDMRFRNKESILEASRRMDSLREKLSHKIKNSDSVKSIRKWRDEK